MRKYILRLFAMVLFLIMITSRNAQPQEKEPLIQPKKEVIVHIKYGEHDGEFGRKDFGDQFPIEPRAFAFDSQNNIYIADSIHDIPRVQVFNHKGKFVRKIPFKSRLAYPVPIDITIKNNKLYLLLFRDDIQVFELMGQPIRTINFFMDYDVNKKWTEALNNPSRLEVDTVGNIYLSTRLGALVKLDPQGKMLQTWSYASHYLDCEGNLFVMELSKESSGRVVKYGLDGHKISEIKCEDLFPAPKNQSCSLPEFMDKKGRMYRKFEERYKDGEITRIIRYKKNESVKLDVDLYYDEISDYYKVDGEGAIYTIKGDLIKYSTPD